MFKYLFVGLGTLALVAGQASGQPSERWQYCRVETVVAGGSVNQQGNIEASARICVFTENGCQNEDVTFSEPPASSEGRRKWQVFHVQEVANARALAQLGRQGWEMTGVVQGDSSAGTTVFYFKRRL